MKKVIFAILFFLITTVFFVPANVKASSANTSINDALEIDLNSEVETLDDEIDRVEAYYYKLRVEEQGKFSVKIRTKEERGFQLRLLNNKGDELAYEPTDLFWVLGLPQGDYYLKVEPDEFPDYEPFTLEFSFAPNKYFVSSIENNSIETATPMIFNTTYEGYKFNQDDDYFIFQITEARKIGFRGRAIIGSSLYDSLRFSLFDYKGELITKIFTNNDDPVGIIQTVDLNEGTYYINVESFYDYMNGSYIVEVITSNFEDLSVDHWAAKEIAYLSNYGIIKGYQDGTFKPEDEIKRGQAAVMFVRALGLEINNRPDPGFNDVSKNHIYYKEIATAVDEGIFPRGESFNAFSPLTRADMARAIVNAYDLKGNFEGEISDVLSSHWAYKYVGILAENNITKLYNDGSFKPDKTVNRAQFSTFFARVLDDRFKQTN
ncbi:S-layer homology domain-containing protein [Bacillus sp. SCS-151]|uniref:S-layer homology domain-containing protein n=1 Tax=Nanhaiella sioensis TaxID=3115293 RepID=UPI00397D913A